MDSNKLDPTDIGILNLLQQDAKYTLKEIAHKLHRNKSVIDRRIKWLEQNGYVSRYVALIDAKKIKGLFTAFPLIQLADHREDTFIAFQLLVQLHKEVMECHHVMGQYDFLLKIVVGDSHQYNDFLRKNISTLSFVKKVESFPVLAEVKKETAYFIDQMY